MLESSGETLAPLHLKLAPLIIKKSLDVYMSTYLIFIQYFLTEVIYVQIHYFRFVEWFDHNNRNSLIVILNNNGHSEYFL